MLGTTWAELCQFNITKYSFFFFFANRSLRRSWVGVRLWVRVGYFTGKKGQHLREVSLLEAFGQGHMDLLLHGAAAGGESPLLVDPHQLVPDLRVDEGREELLCDGLIGAYKLSEVAGVFHLLYGLLLGLLRLFSSALGCGEIFLRLLSSLLGGGKLLLQLLNLDLDLGNLLLENSIFFWGAFGSALGGSASTGFGAANASLKPIEVSCASPCGNEVATSSTVWGLRCGNNAVMTTRGDFPWLEVLTSPAGVGVRNGPSCSSPSAEACSTSSIWSKELSFVSGSSDLREKVDSKKSFEGRGALFIGDARGRSTVAPCGVSLFEVFSAKRHAPVYRSPPSSHVTARMWRRIKRWPGRLGIAVHPKPLLYVAIVALQGERAR
nr:hypothetical protein Iba_chr10fCG7340 [Ipomoea batatas]